MAEKELRKMSRPELIEIIYALKSDAVRLEKENAELKEQLRNRRIRIEQAGSIAEAAMNLNHVFESAQSAADDYLNSIKQELDQARFLKEEAWKLFETARKEKMELQEKTENRSEELREGADAIHQDQECSGGNV